MHLINHKIFIVFTILIIFSSCIEKTKPTSINNSASHNSQTVASKANNVQKTGPIAIQRQKILGKAKEAKANTLIEFKINGNRATNTKTPIIINDETISITGWAIDSAAKRKATKLFLDWNGSLIEIKRYNLKTNHLAKQYNNGAYANCGFQILLPASNFQKGSHKVGFVVIGQKGNYYYQAPKKRIDLVIS